MIFLSCAPERNNHSQNTDSISIEFNATEIILARRNDSDMNQSINPIHQTARDLFENIDAFDYNQRLLKILNRPFEKLEFSMFENNAGVRLFDRMDELLNIFNINIPQSEIEKFDFSGHEEFIKVKTENLSICIYRAGNIFRVFFIEYDNNMFYEPKLRIGYSKHDIINLLGNPSTYSNTRNIFIYFCYETWRQINIHFDDNEEVKFVQLITWIDL